MWEDNSDNVSDVVQSDGELSLGKSCKSQCIL